jgi:hypothetical protein
MNCPEATSLAALLDEATDEVLGAGPRHLVEPDKEEG